MAPVTTPLHSWHRQHGARMALFGGYDMPLWYASAKDEHLAVLTHAGIFDTSHMAVVLVEGPGAFDLLQFCFTNDLAACLGPHKAPLKTGRAVYGAFLTADGHVLDDAIVFMLAAGVFLVVVNAGMGHAVAMHLERHRADRDVRVQDLSGQFGKMDVQGPMAARIMRDVLADPEQVFEAMPYFAFKGGFSETLPFCGRVATTDGVLLLLSRTGYTGEFYVGRDNHRRLGSGHGGGRLLWRDSLWTGRPRFPARRRCSAPVPPGHWRLALLSSPLALCTALSVRDRRI